MLARIRAYYAQEQVLEVETPNLCTTVGTDPYLDYLTAGTGSSIDGSEHCLYLQTSPEFAMKRLLAAGSGSIYQICKAFRNGEFGRCHNPEFTILEWYRVGYDLKQLMDDIDRLLGPILGLDIPGKRFTYQQVFLDHCRLDPLEAAVAEFKNFAQEAGDEEAVKLCGDEPRAWQEYLFTTRVQPALGQDGLCFVHDYPANQCALAQIKPNDSRVAERMEVFCQGMELGNGYRELVCPIEQRERFETELEVRRSKGKDCPALDERFLLALDAGLPSCSGVAIGLDRVLMLLVGAESIDEVMGFSLPRA